MDIIESRNRMLGETLVKNLERRHFEAYYCPTSEEAITKVLGQQRHMGRLGDYPQDGTDGGSP